LHRVELRSAWLRLGARWEMIVSARSDARLANDNRRGPCDPRRRH